MKFNNARASKKGWIQKKLDLQKGGVQTKADSKKDGIQKKGWSGFAIPTFVHTGLTDKQQNSY